MICGNCELIIIDEVIVTCEPEEHWCLKCAVTNEVTFITPESVSGYDELIEACRFWNCDIKEAYNRLEGGEDIYNYDDE